MCNKKCECRYPHGVLVRACDFHVESYGFKSRKPLLDAKAVDCQQFGTIMVMLSYRNVHPLASSALSAIKS